MAYTAERLAELLNMECLPEGGRFVFCGTTGQLLPQSALSGFSGPRETCSCIYYLLRRGEISRWHKLRAAEFWMWHQGGSLEMTLGGAGDMPAAGERLSLGPRLERGERFHIMVPGGCWQTARVTDGDFVLVTCAVTPAYRDEDCFLPERPLRNEIYGERR